MRKITVIENAAELAALCINRKGLGVTVDGDTPCLPDGAKILVRAQTGQVFVEAEGFSNEPIHVVDLIRVVAEGYGVKVEQC